MNEINNEVQKVRRLNYQSIIVVFLMVIGIGIIVLLQSEKFSFSPAQNAGIEKGVAAPNFTLPDLDGKMVSLADYRDQVVLLNIWATWCAPCVAEMPSMEKLYQELKGEKFVILAVSIDEEGDEVVRPFMKKHNLSFPALIDRQGTLKTLYQITGVPESFIIDRSGRIADKVVGPREWASAAVIGYFRSLMD